mgnify:CR=1 FL=1
MKLEAKREQLLKPLQHVIGAVERRQTLPILTNVLLMAGEHELNLTATDLGRVKSVATISAISTSVCFDFFQKKKTAATNPTMKITPANAHTV